MNKRETVWLIVKLIGAYFIYLAFVSLFSLISAVSALTSTTSPDATAAKTDANTATAVSPVVSAPDGFPARPVNPANKAPDKNALDPATKKLRDEAIKNLLFYIFLTALYGALGFYVIRDGRVLFWVLNREGAIAKKEKEINSLGIFDDAK